MRPNRMSARVALQLAALVMLTASGCASGDSPTAPVTAPEPPVTIKTPTSFIVTRILCQGFNRNAPDGGDWDWAVFVEDRKPDISVSLKGAPAFPIFNSDMRLNANYNGSYTFTKPASASDGFLPRVLDYSTACSVALVDDDPVVGNTIMANIAFRGATMYRLDNAAALDHTFHGANGVVLRLQGTWVY